jgi:D-sedoheptulose 7-phosphate isomerase
MMRAEAGTRAGNGTAMIETIRKRFDECVGVLRLTEEHLAGRVAAAAELIVACYKAGGGVLLFGNGGSAADAQHAAGELVGRFLCERRALRAEALSADGAVLTCVANDYDFEHVFARQIEGKGSPGDVAVALTTSGTSPNVVAGLAAARRAGLKTIALTGAGGGRCAELADVLLDVPCDGPPGRIQEAHVLIYHVLCELVEAAIADAPDR